MTLRLGRYRHAILPHIYIDGAAAAIKFYRQAFGAVELCRIAQPSGRILRAEISIAGSVIMLGDPDERLYAEPRKLGRCTAGLHILVDDNAALMRHAAIRVTLPIWFMKRQSNARWKCRELQRALLTTCGCCGSVYAAYYR
jgi:hypothetical protein